LLNDSDVDAYGESLRVVGFRQGTLVALAGNALTGAYGTLTLNADGSFTYTVDDANPLVQALRTAAQTLSETFTYARRDLAGAAELATLTVQIHGRNDDPVAHDEVAVAVEQGGTLNRDAGVDPAFNPLANDTDVDSGDTQHLTGIRAGTEAAGGDFTGVT